MSGVAGAPRPRSAKSSFLADFTATSAAQVLSVGLNALSLALISRRLGQVDLGVYTLERRGMSILQPFVLLGLSVATPRFVALSLEKHSGEAESYALTGSRIVFVVSALFAAFAVAVPAPVAEIFFGDSSAVGLARVLGAFTFATACFQIAYSVSRGYLHMGRANVAEIAAVGAIPLILAAIGPTDILNLMWWLAGGVALVALVLAVSEPGLRAGLLSPGRHATRAARAALLRYGLARTPGDFAAVALFALAPIAVVHWAGPTDAGYTSIVVTALSFVAVGAVPLGVLLLPRVAVDVSATEKFPHEKYVMLAEATADISFALAGLLFVASPLVAEFWIPDAPAQVVTGMEVASIGIPGYVFYLVFRSYLDAIDRRPLSSAATIGGLGALVVLLPSLLALDAFEPTVSAAVALLVALNVAGLVTYRLVSTRVEGFMGMGFVAPVAAVLVLSLPLGFATRDLGLLLVIAATALAGIAFLLALGLSRRRWIAELRTRIAERTA